LDDAIQSATLPIDETPDSEYTINMTLKAENIPINRWWDVWIALFTLGAVSLMGARLWATEWTADLYILVYLAFFAALTGIALGSSRFSPWFSAVIAAVYGVFITGWLFGTTVELELSWRDRLLKYLGWRLRLTIEQFLNGNSLSDPILFLTVMALLLWLIGVTAAFILIREGAVWPAMIPLGMTILIISHYDQDLARNTRFLMTFLLLTLLVLGRMAFLRNKRKWRQEGIHTTTEIHADINKTLILLTLSLLVLAWLIPVTPQQVDRYSELWDTLTQPWNRFTEQIADIFVFDQTPTTTSSGFFGDSLSLGNGIPASEDEVFTVEVISPPPPSYRNYWRTRSYDTYKNPDWSSSSGLISNQIFPDDPALSYPDWEGGETATYKITADLRSTSNLYAPGLPIRADRPVEALTQTLPEDQVDLVAFLADPNWVEGETYEVTSLVRLPTEAELRASSTVYPVWIERYLQLPEDFSSDVADLASEIARGEDNPFDIAYAITRYLRINIEYSRTLPPVPSGADPMEWFLFDEMRGFCNYYATAQVLMLRSLGIPARIAVGFAQGDYDSQADTFTVRRRDSHAWPEVYFVDHGWVIFEPTVSQPALILPAGRGPLDDTANPAQPGDIPQMDDPLATPESLDGSAITSEETQPAFQFRGSRVIWGIFILFLIGLSFTVLILLRPSFFKMDIAPLPVLLERSLDKRGKTIPPWVQRWSQIAQMSAPEKAYRQLGHAIKLLGHPLNRAQTPAERAQALLILLPGAAEPVWAIVNEYTLDQYSNHIINEERAKTAARQVRKLTFAAWLSKLNPIKLGD
jgi:transglutaminase-like putative cysteine protease